MEIAGVLLMLFLGLRHGFDPDHIAIIDGVSMQISNTRPSLAVWTGTLFATGHGAVITMVAVMISRFNHSFHFPPIVWSLLDWVPGLLLFAVGLVNLKLLLSPQSYKPVAFRSRLLPSRLTKSSSRLAIILMGVFFALVFDSTTQAAAWAYTATSQINTNTALLLGLSFSTGMILTDTTDSRILCMLINGSKTGESAAGYRRKLGWIIVIISLLVGIYKTITLIIPGLLLPDMVLSAVGIFFFLVMVSFYTYIMTFRRKLKKPFTYVD